jgi:hypothetical protein
MKFWKIYKAFILRPLELILSKGFAFWANTVKKSWTVIVAIKSNHIYASSVLLLVHISYSNMLGGI